LIGHHAPKWRVHLSLVLTDSISSIHLDIWSRRPSISRSVQKNDIDRKIIVRPFRVRAVNVWPTNAVALWDLCEKTFISRSILFHQFRRVQRPETDPRAAYRNDLFSIAFLSDEMSDVPCILGPLVMDDALNIAMATSFAPVRQAQETAA
jgi:hypothetical protein